MAKDTKPNCLHFCHVMSKILTLPLYLSTFVSYKVGKFRQLWFVCFWEASVRITQLFLTQ